MSEKTEQPTAKRLRESREKGDVCKSQDISSALTVLAVGIYFIMMAETIFKTISASVTLSMTMVSKPFDESLPLIAQAVLIGGFKIVAPLVALVIGVTLLGNLAQVGVVFAFKAAIPKLENVSASKWFKKVFSVKNAVEFLKNIAKVCVLCIVVWSVLKDHIRTLFIIQQGNIGGLWTVLGATTKDLVLMSASAFCSIAALDYLFQRWQYTKKHMMSKDEVKREYKEMEGDPHIKGKRKQLHRELLAQNSLDNVRRAKVLVTNPTHIAVALDYEKEKTPLPVILAKGEGQLARRMVEVAKQEGIPIMQNVPLARGLFEDGTENAYIPRNMIGPVAEVLRWVQSLNQ